jgi:aminopeptidase N
MKKHALGNTTSDDLWREMDAVAGQPISTMALTFTRQPGIPLIRVEDAQCKNGRTTLSLSQAEFSIDQPNKTPLRWQVPVVAKALGSTQAGRTVVRDGTGSVTVEGCGPVVLNAGQAGYYRTAYSAALLQGLTKSFAELDAKDQLGLMGDGWALSRAGLQPVGHYLDLVNATPLTASAQVWDAIAKNLGGLSFWYQDNAAQRAQYDQFVISKLSPLMQRLGWTAATNEPDPIGLLRQELIRSLGTLGDPTVVAEARRRFAVRQSDANALPGALRDSILMVVAFHSDEATWNALHHEAKSETSPMLKNHWYRLLGQAKDKALARKALELALTDEVNATSKAVMISAVAYEHPDMAFDFAMAHLSDVEKMVDSTAVRFFPRLAQRSTDPQMVNKLKAYADQHVPVTSHSSTEQAINSITVRLHSMQLLRPQIDAWLASHRS